MSEPAFPATDSWGAPTAGLTKREWFAAHVPEWWMAKRCGATQIEWAYAYADAMLAASKEPKP